MKRMCLISLCLLSGALSAQTALPTRNVTPNAPEANTARVRLNQERAELDAKRAQTASRAAQNRARIAEQSAHAASQSAEEAAVLDEQAARRGGRNSRQTAPTDQEQLAIAALEGLMAATPERALPLLKRVLEGPQTDLVKMRALFVLSQIDNDEAQQLLLNLARSNNGDLRLEALRMIGIGGNDKALAALTDIYRSGDAAVRQEVLSAYLIAGRKKEVLQLARDAKNEEEANAAIHTLGAMDALAELRQLGDMGKYSSALVHAYGVAGDLASLRKLASTSSDSQLRLEAIRSIGILDNKEAGAALAELYHNSKDPQARQAALDGLMIMGDEQTLLKIYRDSKDAEEKRSVLRQLTVIGGDAAIEAIDAALQGKAP